MDRRRVGVIVGATVALALVVAGAFFATRWWQDRDEVDPDALDATATLQLVGSGELPQALSRLGGLAELELLATGGDQLVVGQVSWRPPSTTRGRFEVLLIDKRVDKRPPTMSAAPAGTGSVTVSPDTRAAGAVDRYPWLKGAAPVQEGTTTVRGGVSVTVPLTVTSPLTFVALFPGAGRPAERQGAATAPVALDDLLLALVYVSADDRVIWAERLHG